MTIDRHWPPRPRLSDCVIEALRRRFDASAAPAFPRLAGYLDEEAESSVARTPVELADGMEPG